MQNVTWPSRVIGAVESKHLGTRQRVLTRVHTRMQSEHPGSAGRATVPFQKGATTRADELDERRSRRCWRVSRLALAGLALAGCSDAGRIEEVRPALGVLRSAITSEAARIVAALQAGSDGAPGLLVREVGGPALSSFNETLVYNPASTIKIVVAVSLLQQIEAGAPFDLGTAITHFTGLDGSCPTGSGPAQRETLGQLMFLMLELSDNAATRTLVDLVGGFAAVNATAQSIGMLSTSLRVYPGCNVTNTITLADAALVYEGVASGALISAASRDALFAAMPADAGDFSGTLAAARFIADAEAAAANVPAAATELFKSQLALHYKAGNDIWCDPSCLSTYAISGLAEIPTCSEQGQTSQEYVWGLFISNGTNENDTASTFFANQAEPLRQPIREALATWASCAAVPGQTGAPCDDNGDCHSFVCAAGVCQPSSCAPACHEGAPCGAAAECGSGVCSESGICHAPACSPSCSTGEVCGDNGDCSSFVCTNNRCAPATCAPTCAVGAPCGESGDCASRVCDDGTCTRPACSPRCRPRGVCSDNGDCASRRCVANRCR